MLFIKIELQNYKGHVMLFMCNETSVRNYYLFVYFPTDHTNRHTDYTKLLKNKKIKKKTNISNIKNKQIKK